MNAFFPQTTNALKNITDMFDLLWPMTTALWNLRCNVKGFLAESPNATQELLNQRFASGSDIEILNFKASIIDKTWESQKEEISWILLGWLFSIYEGWLSELRDEVFNGMDNKKLQYPEKFQNEINRYTSAPSIILKKCIFPAYSKCKKVSTSKIKNMLYCCRVFKEMRNCYMHHSKKADQKLLDSYNMFMANIKSPQDLHVKEIPEILPISLGKPITPSFRGVVGFSNVLINLILSIEAEFIKSKDAELWFNKCIMASPQKKQITFSNIQSKAIQQMNKLVTNCGFYRTIHFPEDLLKHIKGLTP
ncbi:MAG: hypothetical protein IIV41_11420 [Akkermansia sp.]|nr:hypothetical protein [Akkermansia sp.]